MGLGMLLAFVAAMLLSVGASTLAAYLSFVPFVGVVVGAAVMIGLLLLIYWVVPNRRQRWRDVWPGAVLCGVLIEVLTLVWPIYTRLMHGFNTYGQTFGLFFLLATWLYFMSALMLLGAVFNKMRLGGQPVPQAEGAPALAAVQDAERRRVQVKSSGRRRPET
jgi:membrane protein